jgi:hypothetical protein
VFNPTILWLGPGKSGSRTCARDRFAVANRMDGMCVNQASALIGADAPD